MKIGMNSTCPCGSGKKYKKCCLISEQIVISGSEDRLWQQQYTMQDELTSRILDHARSKYGDMAVFEAWEDFNCFDDELEPLNSESHDLSIFIPWFVYDWIPCFPESSLIESDWTKNLSPANSMLKKRDKHLSELESDYIRACISSPFTFTEVVACDQGNHFYLKDILTGKEWKATEKNLSHVAQKGDVIFCRPITVRNLTTLAGCAPFPIPPIYKSQLIDIRNEIKKKFKKIDNEVLFECSLELLEIFRSLYKDFINAETPDRYNSDEEKFSPQTVTFKIAKPNAALEALASLDVTMSKEEILNDAEFDKSDNLELAEFAWSKKGNNKNKSWDNTILGHLTIENNTLEAYVNSTERAKLFRSIVEKRLAENALYVDTSPTPADLVPEEEVYGDTELFQDDLPEIDPKLLEEAKSAREEYWANWINEKSPILKNKTPKQAAKNQDGREKLEAMLTQFERDTTEYPQPGESTEIFQDIRKQLGIGK